MDTRPGVPQGNILGHSLCYANDMVIGIDPELKHYLYVNDSIILFYHSNQDKKGGKDQETIQSSTTPDPGYNMGK